MADEQAPKRRPTVAARITAAAQAAEPGTPIVIRVTSVEVEAAKLRVAVDRKMKAETPLWVLKLAAAKGD
jgi:hypothetical protein